MMDLLASAIWLLIIINIFVELHITNKYFIVALLIIVLIEVWEKLYGDHNNTSIMLFQGIILILALYYTYGFNYILPVLVIVVFAFLYSLFFDKCKDLYNIIIILTFFFVFSLLWMYNRIFIVSFPAIIFAFVTFAVLLSYMFGK